MVYQYIYYNGHLGLDDYFQSEGLLGRQAGMRYDGYLVQGGVLANGVPAGMFSSANCFYTIGWAYLPEAAGQGLSS